MLEVSLFFFPVLGMRHLEQREKSNKQAANARLQISYFEAAILEEEN